MLQRFCKIVILGTFGIPDCCHQKQQYQLVQLFDVYLHAKSKVVAHLFLEILQIYSKLVILGTLDMSTPTKNDSINVETNVNFHLRTKNQLHTFFFIEILHFKESCNLIAHEHFWPITRELGFCQIWACSEISTPM